MSYILAPSKEMLTPLLTFCLCGHKGRIFASAHFLSFAEPTMAYAHRSFAHALARGPFLNMNTNMNINSQTQNRSRCPGFICFRACLQQWHLLCGEHPNSWVRVCHLKWCVIKQDDQKGCQMNSNDINLERICFYFGPTAVIFSRLRLKGHLGPSKIRRCWSGQPWSARWRSPHKSRISSNWSRFQGSNTNHRTITLNHLPLLAQSRFTGLFLNADISAEFRMITWYGADHRSQIHALGAKKDNNW